jgi:hypothetical protein
VSVSERDLVEAEVKGVAAERLRRLPGEKQELDAAFRRLRASFSGRWEFAALEDIYDAFIRRRDCRAAEEHEMLARVLRGEGDDFERSVSDRLTPDPS